MSVKNSKSNNYRVGSNPATPTNKSHSFENGFFCSLNVGENMFKPRSVKIDEQVSKIEQIKLMIASIKLILPPRKQKTHHVTI